MKKQALAAETAAVDQTNPLVRDGANRQAMRALVK